MKTVLFVTAFAVGAWIAPQQASLATQGLVRVAPQSPNSGGASRALNDSFDEAAWRERLAVPDLDARMFSFNQLADLAQRDDNVRRQVETWARSPNSSDLAWTARLLIRELDSAASVSAVRPPRGLWRIDPFGEDPFSVLQQQLDTWMRPSPGRGTPLWPAPNSSAPNSTRRTHSLEITPDGVKARVTEDVDGKETTKEYSASSLDELLDAHPELRDELGVEVGDSPLGRGLEFFFGEPNSSAGPDDQGQAAVEQPSAPVSVRTDVLGVALESLDAEERVALGLEADVGLRILRVASGTIAERLGLQRGQVLVELNGAPVRTRDDVTTRVRERTADAEVRAAVVDRWGQKLEARWRPDGARSM